MSLQRWARYANFALLLGGTGYLVKYVLLAVFDPHGNDGSAPLRIVTVLGLLLGEVLIPVGATAFPATWLRGSHPLLVVLGFVIAIALVLVAARVLDAAFGSLAGDPLRLHTEGTLAVLGSAAVLSRLAL